ncbi:MAG: hypothetical protein JRE28_14845 [Deltaproteobacteria bacterium]|nr:hypothetical protein [Deltaproteobacteria bacterium]
MLIILAECRDGVGSKTFLPWFEMGNWKKAFDRLAHSIHNPGPEKVLLSFPSTVPHRPINFWKVNFLDMN